MNQSASLNYAWISTQKISIVNNDIESTFGQNDPSRVSRELHQPLRNCRIFVQVKVLSSPVEILEFSTFTELTLSAL